MIILRTPVELFVIAAQNLDHYLLSCFFFFFLIKDQWRHGIPDTQHLHKNRPEDRGSTARGHIGVYMHVILDKCMVYKHME